jgi:hypothetical protein
MPSISEWHQVFRGVRTAGTSQRLAHVKILPKFLSLRRLNAFRRFSNESFIEIKLKVHVVKKEC